MSTDSKIYEDKPKQPDITTRAALFEVFKKFDKDNSGSIEQDEIEKVANELNVEINKNEVIQIFKDLDVNGDRHIDFEEFFAWWSSGRPNKLERLVYYKLKINKLWRKAAADFSRIGTSLENKYEKIDSYQFACNFCDHQSKFQLSCLALVDHQDYQEEVKSIVKGFKIPEVVQQQTGEQPQQASKSQYNIVFRIQTLNAVDFHLQLQKNIDNYYNGIASLKGQEVVDKMKQYFSLNVQSSETDVALIGQVNADLMDSVTSSQDFQFMKDLSIGSNIKFQLELSTKNGLHDLLGQNSNVFVKWLLNGFKFNLKLSANSELVQKFKQFIKDWASQLLFPPSQQDDNYKIDDDTQNLFSIIIISTMLDSFKFNLVFRNQDHIDEVFKGLGLDTMAKDQPTNEELFKEISQLTGISQWKKEEKNEAGFSEHSSIINFIETFTKYGQGEANLSFFSQNKLLSININAAGLGELLTYMLHQDLQ